MLEPCLRQPNYSATVVRNQTSFPHHCNGRLVFAIDIPTRRYFIEADNQQSYDEWIQAVQDAISPPVQTISTTTVYVQGPVPQGPAPTYVVPAPQQGQQYEPAPQGQQYLPPQPTFGYPQGGQPQQFPQGGQPQPTFVYPQGQPQQFPQGGQPYPQGGGQPQTYFLAPSAPPKPQGN